MARHKDVLNSDIERTLWIRSGLWSEGCEVNTNRVTNPNQASCAVRNGTGVAATVPIENTAHMPGKDTEQMSRTSVNVVTKTTAKIV